MSDIGTVPEPSPPGGLSRALLLELHAGLGRLQEGIGLLQREQGFPPGALDGLSEPAAAAGIAAAIALHRSADGKGDWLAHGPGSEAALLAMGVSPAEFAERVAAAWAGPEGGRRGGIPWNCSQRGFSGTDASPGTLVEVMAGITLAFRLRGGSRVGMVLTDSASAATGAWHEGLNFAAVRRCPMVVVLLRDEPGDGAHRLPGAGAMAAAYGAGWRSVYAATLPGVTSAALDAVQAARNGGGVQLLEVRLPGPETRLPIDVQRDAMAEAAGLTFEERAEPDFPGGQER